MYKNMLKIVALGIINFSLKGMELPPSSMAQINLLQNKTVDQIENDDDLVAFAIANLKANEMAMKKNKITTSFTEKVKRQRLNNKRVQKLSLDERVQRAVDKSHKKDGTQINGGKSSPEFIQLLKDYPEIDVNSYQVSIKQLIHPVTLGHLALQYKAENALRYMIESRGLVVTPWMKIFAQQLSTKSTIRKTILAQTASEQTAGTVPSLQNQNATTQSRSLQNHAWSLSFPGYHGFSTPQVNAPLNPGGLFR
jgi:hypothetical protein